MSKATSKALQQAPAFLGDFIEDAAQADERLASTTFNAPISLRATSVKGQKGRVGVIEIVNPQERDDNNNPKVTQVKSLNVVLLNHTMTRQMRYKAEDGKFKAECYSVGPKKTGVGVGTLHRQPMSCLECSQAFPDGFDRNFIEYGTDRVTRGKVKCGSRYQMTVLLPREHWVDGEPTLAVMYLPMSSVYGISIKRADEAPDRAKTLLAYPDRQDREQHKGVLLQLRNRPWEYAAKFGHDVKTPETAIYLTLTADWLGDVNTPVPAFEVGDELDEDMLAVVNEAKAAGMDLAREQIKQNLRDAAPAISDAKRAPMIEAAVQGEYEAYSDQARLALPVAAEFVDEGDAPEDAEQIDVQSTTPPALAAQLEEEFPPEEDLPFD